MEVKEHSCAGLVYSRRQLMKCYKTKYFSNTLNLPHLSTFLQRMLKLSTNEYTLYLSASVGIIHCPLPLSILAINHASKKPFETNTYLRGALFALNDRVFWLIAFGVGWYACALPAVCLGSFCPCLLSCFSCAVSVRPCSSAS